MCVTTVCCRSLPPSQRCCRASSRSTLAGSTSRCAQPLAVIKCLELQPYSQALIGREESQAAPVGCQTLPLFPPAAVNLLMDLLSSIRQSVWLWGCAFCHGGLLCICIGHGLLMPCAAALSSPFARSLLMWRGPTLAGMAAPSKPFD